MIDVLQLMLGFGTFIVSFLGLVVVIVKFGQKK
ncbi:putative holin-like toxin [Dellaglioa sp. BT-FLS60]